MTTHFLRQTSARSSLTELILSPTSNYSAHHDPLDDEGDYLFRCFHSLDTLTVIGLTDPILPFRYYAFKSIRYLHLSDTNMQLRKICAMLLDFPPDLVSLVVKQRPLGPYRLRVEDELPTPTAPTLSEALLLRGSQLQQLTLVFCYSTCLKNFIGQGRRLTSLPTLVHLEKLTI